MRTKVFIFTVMFLLLVVASAKSDTSYTRPFISNGKLYVEITKKTLLSNNLPDILDESDSETVYDLFTGKISSKEIEDPWPKVTRYFGLPLSGKYIYSDKIVSYDNGSWDEKNLPIRKEMYSCWGLTAWWMIIPMTFIVFAFSRMFYQYFCTRNFIYVHASNLLAIIVPAIVGLYTTREIGGLSGFVMTFVLGYLLKRIVFNGNEDYDFIRAPLFSARFLMGIISGVLANTQGYLFVVNYLISITIVGVVAFLVLLIRQRRKASNQEVAITT